MLLSNTSKYIYIYTYLSSGMNNRGISIMDPSRENVIIAGILKRLCFFHAKILWMTTLTINNDPRSSKIGEGGTEMRLSIRHWILLARPWIIKMERHVIQMEGHEYKKQEHECEMKDIFRLNEQQQCEWMENHASTICGEYAVCLFNIGIIPIDIDVYPNIIPIYPNIIQMQGRFP